MIWNLRRRLHISTSLTTMVAAAVVVAIPKPSDKAQAQTYTWGGAGSTTQDTNYNSGANWSTPGGAPPPPVTAGQNAVFGATGNPSISVQGTITPDSWTFSNAAQPFAISGGTVSFGTAAGLVDSATNQQRVSTNITGLGGVTVNQGAGILTLSGTNNYTGSTYVYGGTLQAASNNAFSSNSSYALLNGTTLNVNGFSNSIGSLEGQKGTFVVLGSGTLSVGANNTSTIFNGNVGVPGDTGGLTKTGTGTLTLSGTSYYSGATLVTGGILQAASPTAFSSTSAFTITNGATLDLGGNNNSIGSLEGQKGTYVLIGGPKGTTLTVGNVGNSAYTVFFGNLGAAAGDTGGLTKTGSGTLVLSGTSTYSGQTTLNSGTLAAGAVNSFSPNSSIVLNGGTLNANGFAENIPLITMAAGSTAQIVNFPTANVKFSGGIYSINGINSVGSVSGSGQLNFFVDLLSPSNQLNVANNISGVNVSITVKSPVVLPPQGVTVLTSGSGADKLGVKNGDLFYSAGFIQESAKVSPTSISIVSNVNNAAVTSLSGSLSAVFGAVQSTFFQPASSIIVAASGGKPDTWTGGPWIRFSDGYSNIKATGTDSAVRLSAASNTHIDFRGFQTGFDTGAININASQWNAHLGVTGGLVTADTTDLTGGDASHVSLPFIGTYAAVKNDTFSADINYRHDFVTYSANDAGIFNGSNLKAGGNTIFGNVQYGFNVQGFSITPAAELSFSHYQVNPINVQVSQVLSLSKLDSLLGRFGVQVGRSFSVTDTFVVQPFTTGAVWHEFAGNTLTDFSALRSDTQAVGSVDTVSTNRVGTFGQVGIGLVAQIIPVGFTGFIRGDVRFGDRVNGLSGTAGMRYTF